MNRRARKSRRWVETATAYALLSQCDDLPRLEAEYRPVVKDLWAPTHFDWRQWAASLSTVAIT